MSQPHFLQYPRNEYSAECKRIVETEGFGGETPRPATVLKHVFPEIRNDGRPLQYDLRTAVVLTSAGIRNDLNALVHTITLKGMGASDTNQRTKVVNRLQDPTDYIFEQIGLGPVQGVLWSLANGFYFHVSNSLRHTIDVVIRGEKYGHANIATFVLDDPKYLPNNGFPIKPFGSMPEHSTGVVLSRIKLTMSREQVARLLEQKRHVPARYGNVPRIIFRVQHPDSLYDNWGPHPQMQLHSLFAESRTHRPIAKSVSVPIEPVERRVGGS